MFKNRLVKVFRHLNRQASRAGASCYRLYDHDLPEFPFIIEVFEEMLSVSEYERRHGMEEKEHETWLLRSAEIISEVTGIPAENNLFRTRQRKKGRKGQYRKFEEEGKEFIVKEGGLKFIVNLTDYLDTGLFLDHRVTRELVRKQSGGRSVLNLFAYTGSFSVYAAAGGAKRVHTVDLSNTYLQWARRNMELNGFAGEGKYTYQQADVLQFLGGEGAGPYDLIILDPPTFSNSKRMKEVLDVQRDHVKLINGCLDILSTGGSVIFSTNYSKFEMDEKNVRGEVKDITRATTPFDFEGKLKRYCFLVS